MGRVYSSSSVKLFLIVAGAWMGIACGDASLDDTNKVPASIDAFSASTERMEFPGLVRFAWETSNAASVNLLQNGAAVDLGDSPLTAGSIELHVAETSEFELIATGKRGTPATKTVQVEVFGNPPSIGSFQATEVVGLNELGVAVATLSWSGVVGASELLLEADTLDDVTIDLASAPTGSMTVDLVETTAFTLVARNPLGEARQEASTRVVPYPVIDSLAADRTWVGISEDVTITWSTQGVSQIELWINGERAESVESNETSSTHIFAPLMDTELELRATNEVGTIVSEFLQITVAPPMIHSFEGSPMSRWLGQPLTLSWDTEGGREVGINVSGEEGRFCASDDLEVVDASSCEWQITERGEHSFTLSVSNNSGISSDVWTVVVGSGPQILSFTTTSAHVSLGEAITLRWETLPDPDGEAPTLILEDDRGTTYTVSAEDQMLVVVPEEPGAYNFELTATTSSELSVPVKATASAEVHRLPTVTLDAAPTYFDEVNDDDVTLSWTSSSAGTSLIIYRIVEGLLVEHFVVPEEEREAGEYHFIPTDDYTYRIIATNGAGATAMDDVTVTLAPPRAISFTADREEIAAGQPVLLTWETEMAQQVDISTFGSTYVAEETMEPYFDASAEAGAFNVPLTIECVPSTTNIWVDSRACEVIDLPNGFKFPFDGEDRTRIRVYASGLISFDHSFVSTNANVNESFPSAAKSFAHIAPFWDALAWDRGRFLAGNLYLLHRTDAVAGDSVVIQWKDISLSGESYWPNTTMNFEVILWQNGDFEYRYGEMVSEFSELSNEFANGSLSTIGFQLTDRSDFEMLNFNQSIRIRGPLHMRTFRFKKLDALPKSGTFLWYPYTTTDDLVVTMTASRGAFSDSKTLSLVVKQRPVIDINLRPREPVVTDTDFRIGWLTQFSTQVQVFDGSGAQVCHTDSPASVTQGFCEVREPTPGDHVYRLVATGAHGSTLEKKIPFTAYHDFGISRFETDEESVEAGRGVTLTWEVFNASTISVTANGVEILPPGTPVESGSLSTDPLAVDTTFVLRITNNLGMVREETRHVEMWTIRFDVTPSATDIRPGDPITVTIDAAALDGGPAPIVFGTFPLVEVMDPGSAYVDVSNLGNAAQLPVSQTASAANFEIEFPPGFTFPYFGEELTRINAAFDGFLSLAVAPSTTYSFVKLPTATSPYINVHLAPFWTDLQSRQVGEMWTALLDSDVFVIQWKNVSVSTGSLNGNPYSLNFQVALYRDGTFEYRYGAMSPPATPSSSCYPNTCVDEANGAIAIIGFQDKTGTQGLTLHEGGPYASSPESRPFDGGLANRTFRSQGLVGSGSVTLRPTLPGPYSFCSKSGARVVCKSFRVTADFEIESFAVASPTIGLGEKTTLSWKTAGGKELVIKENGAVILTLTDPATIDQGTLEVQPVINATYTLELTAPGNGVEAQVDVEVIRMALTASASPAAPFPGEPTTISWVMDVRDPTLSPLVIKPMEEITGALFSEFDISNDPDAKVLIIHNTNTSGNPVGNNAQLVTDNFVDFRFNYFGEEKTWVKVSTEGYLSFAEDATSASSGNQHLPADSAVNRRIHIAPFWEDLNTRLNGRVLSKLVNPDTYVIQWSGMSLNNGSSDTNEGSLNFMVILRRSGEFEFRYGSMLPQPVPSTSTTACYPNTCENESNGASATIGYQHPLGTVGSTTYFGGTNRSASQYPIHGGLTGRAWRFQPTSTSGSVQVTTWGPTTVSICTFDTVSGDIFCAEPVEVDTRWGIESFEAGPTPVLRNVDVSITWEVAGLDDLRLLGSDGVVLASYTRANMPLSGAITVRPDKTTTYVLEGSSLGRPVSAEQFVELRAFTLDFEPPAGRFFPGDTVPIPWSMNQLEPGAFAVTTEMTELPAGPGEIGEYKDVRGEPGAVEAPWSAANGHSIITIPFPFPYFGTFYTEVQAYVDGYLTFDIGTASGISNNTAFPTEASGRRVHLSPFWDDHFRRGAGLGKDTLWLLQPDADTFIIQYTEFNRSGGSGTPDRLYDLNFQIILHASGAFEYRYGRMDPPPPPASNSTCYPATCELEANGSSGSIGYQTVDGSYGYTFHFGGQGADGVVPLPGGLAHRALRFEPVKTGTLNLVLDRSQEVTVCGSVGDFSECKSAFIQAVADPGDLMITELMIDPTGGSADQWFEVRNLSKRFIDLDGFDISTDTGSHKVAQSLVVAPGEYRTLAASTGAGFTPDYVYGATLSMDRMVDTLELSAGTATIGSVNWGVTWTVPSGSTLSLDPSRHSQGTVSNDTFGYWCPGSSAGSPGARTTGCMSNFYDLESYSDLPFIDISTIGTRLTALENSFGLQELPIRNFAMPYYDVVATQIWVSALGFISFAEEYPSGSGNASPSILPRALMTSGSTPVPVVPLGPLVAAYWETLFCTPTSFGCTFHYHRDTFNGQDMVILQWTGYKRGSSTSNAAAGSFTFQAQLWLDGTIVIAFADVESDDRIGTTGWNYYHGSNGWIGLEAPDAMNRDYFNGHHRTITDLSHRTFHFMKK